jgi:hypothetical protein
MLVKSIRRGQIIERVLVFKDRDDNGQPIAGPLTEPVIDPLTGKQKVNLNHRIIEVGEQFDCPLDQLALISTELPHLRPHPDTGWMEAVTNDGRALAAEIKAHPPLAAGVDHGLWPVGHGIGNDALDRVPSRSGQ